MMVKKDVEKELLMPFVDIRVMNMSKLFNVQITMQLNKLVAAIYASGVSVAGSIILSVVDNFLISSMMAR